MCGCLHSLVSMVNLKCAGSVCERKGARESKKRDCVYSHVCTEFWGGQII